MAADVGGDVVLAEFLLDEFGRGEDRPLRTADAEARRTAGDHAREIGDFLALPGLVRRANLRGQQKRRLGAQEGAKTVEHDLAGIFASHRQVLLADQPRAAPGLVQHRGKGLLDVVGLALLDDKHGVLALAEAKELVVNQRVDGVEHIERDVRLAIGVGEAEALQRADDARCTCRPA